jgi:hypothetical protein
MAKTPIEKAYELINEPIDVNMRVPFELAEIVDYKDSEPGETVEYFNTDHSGVDGIYEADSNGSISYHKITLRTPVALTFQGLQSNLETVLIDEILNSKDQTALATKKDGIIRSMDKEEVRRALNLILAVGSQEYTVQTGDDFLKAIIGMRDIITNYATNSILLLGSNAYKAYEDYDLNNADNFHYPTPIDGELKKRGITKVVKVIGTVVLGSETGEPDTALLDTSYAILVGRDSSLVAGKPIKMRRRKFTKEIAELSGAKEGAVRLVNIAQTPQPINGDGANTLGYGAFGYESQIQVLTNYRAVAWSDLSSLVD